MSNVFDRTGLRYGKWMVNARAPSANDRGARWYCSCDCGTKRIVSSKVLQTGQSRSCGCDNWIDLTGQSFGLWRVTERASNDKRGGARWLCLCTGCNTKKIVGSANLRNGTSKSCRCAPHPSALPHDEGAFRVVEDRYKRGAKARGYEWHLSREQFRALCLGDCFYCGEPPSLPTKPTGKPEVIAFLRNGIDRWDSSKFYTPENSVSCCGDCNWAKNTMSGDEYLAWMDRGARFRHPEAFACEAVLEAGNVEIEAARATMQ